MSLIPSPQRASAASAVRVMNDVAGYMRLCQHTSVTPSSMECHWPRMPTLASLRPETEMSSSVQLPD